MRVNDNNTIKLLDAQGKPTTYRISVTMMKYLDDHEQEIRKGVLRYAGIKNMAQELSVSENTLRKYCDHHQIKRWTKGQSGKKSTKPAKLPEFAVIQKQIDELMVLIATLTHVTATIAKELGIETKQ